MLRRSAALLCFTASLVAVPALAQTTPNGAVQPYPAYQPYPTSTYAPSQPPLVNSGTYAQTPPAKTIDRAMRNDPKRYYEDDSSIFSFSFENDIFSGKDNGYSNGVRVGFVSSESWVPDWLRSFANALPFVDPAGHKRVGINVGQSIYTPSDLNASNYIPGDQPYAGYLYASVGLISDTGKNIDTYQFTGGVVGPYSMADRTQKLVHSVLPGQQYPNGWDNQLRNEPGFILTYDHKWRGLYTANPFGMGFGFDATPRVSASVGNVLTNGEAGVLFRFGQNLPEDYGPPLVQPNLAGADFFVPTHDSLGWYLFGGADGQVVGRNIFLDGNTFADSHSVNKNVLVGAFHAGLALTYGSSRLSYTHTYRTKEYETQKDNDQYGSITYAYRF